MTTTMEYIELNGRACDDCTIAIANDDYSGMNMEQVLATSAGLMRLNKNLVIGDELGFEHSKCAVCGGLAGNRHQVGYLE